MCYLSFSGPHMWVNPTEKKQRFQEHFSKLEPKHTRRKKAKGQVDPIPRSPSMEEAELVTKIFSTSETPGCP